MKRDMDLIREILMYIENNYDGSLLVIEKIGTHDQAKILYHAKLLIDNDLVDGSIDKFLSGGGIFKCKGLTWTGQDYLANIKNDKVWSKVKKTVLDKGLDFTLDIIAKLAAKYTNEMLGI